MEEVYDNIMIGDVGGTNVRFQLIRMYHRDPQNKKRKVLKELTKYPS